MNLVRITIEGISRRSPIVLDLGAPCDIQKWAPIGDGSVGRDTLIAIGSSLAPGRIAHLLEPHLGARYTGLKGSFRTEFTYTRDGRDDGTHGTILGGRELINGHWEHLQPRQLQMVQPEATRQRRLSSKTPLGNLVLAYGTAPRISPADSFDFSDTEYPFRRIRSLLDPTPSLTDPVRFLERINAKAYECGTARQKQLLARICRALVAILDGAGAVTRPIKPVPKGSLEEWTARAFPYKRAWRQLRAWQKRVLCVVIDAARHANDAFPRSACPIDQSGILLLDRPDRYCPVNHLQYLFIALDELFPRFQFFLTLGKTARDCFPMILTEKRLFPSKSQVMNPPYKRVRIPPKAKPFPKGSVLLVQVDGTLPNFALMQLSTYLKSQGHCIRLSRGFNRVEEPSIVYASSIFTSETSKRCLERLRRCYADRLVVGGSGIDLNRRLGPNVEYQSPDYSLYPGLGDRAIGFLTRGCPGRCAFCVVPRKEGDVRQVADLDLLLQGRRQKLILLDDNLLAYPRASELLEEMVRRKLSVNFNQTLDLRRLQPEHAELLRRLRCSSLAFHRRVYHFSLNNCRGLDRFRRHYNLLRVTTDDNAEFICMYGYNTSLADDLERLRFLRSLPRAYVCLQRYQPVPGGPAPDLSRLFDEQSDRDLDALVRIVFPQNMKNVERYYRWLCFEYARQRGRIHLGLVDTLFRYNHRHKRGAFLEQLNSIARSPVKLASKSRMTEKKGANPSA